MSTLDLAVVSLTNFISGLLLIRSCPPEEYGTFVSAGTLLLLMVGVHAALVTTPMTVLIPSKAAVDRPPFPLGVMMVQGGLIALLSVLLFGILRLAGDFPGLYRDLFGIVLVIGNAVLLKEFMRSWFYTVLKPGGALRIDLIYGVLWIGSLIVLLRKDSLNAANALWTAGAASLAAAGLSFPVLRGGERFDWNPGILPELLRHGRWGVLGSAAAWAQTQGFVYLLLWRIGPAAVAAAAASRLAFAPLTLISSGWGMIYRPWGARRHAAEPGRLVRALTTATPVLLGIGVVYCGLILALHAAVPALLFGDAYAEIGLSLFMLWALYFLLQIVRGNITNTLQVLREFRSLSGLSVAGAVFTLSAVGLLIGGYGMEGGVLGMAAGEAVLVFLCWPLLRMSLRGKFAGAAAEGEGRAG